MTIDNEKAIVITEKQLKDKAFEATNKLTDEMAEKNPKGALQILAIGAILTAELTKALFDEEDEKPEEETKPELKFGDE